ncbi:hypothetical protein T12_1799 [Trichinella patagoniensis]|uniref:Uncharacterized protein n=1 Tax=Trichinella patagoniensis TaxID=990121 RepID=A0A0V0Z5B3_9BILA|nr:hypothetical protein T12_1799 [Trichinella patagoniensis]
MTVWTPFWRTLFSSSLSNFFNTAIMPCDLVLLYLDFDQHDLSPLKSLTDAYYRYIDGQSEVLKCKITCWKRKRMNVVQPIRLMLSHCTQKITI